MKFVSRVIGYFRPPREDATAAHAGSAFTRLKFAFAFALLIQFCLSGAAIYVSSILLEYNTKMLETSRLATQQESLFQVVANTALRLSAKAENPEQNARSILRVQNQLTHTLRDLEGTIANIATLARELTWRRNLPTVQSDTISDSFGDPLKTFLSNTRTIAALDASDTQAALPYWRDIRLAVAPDGVTARWLKSLITETNQAAETNAYHMRGYLMLINIASLLVVAVIGLAIAYPALRNQKNAILREKKLVQNLHEQTMRDALTRLHNRKSCDEFIAALHQAAPAWITVITIDLNMFKPINDTFGHSAGDAVLINVAQRLKAKAGQNAFVARTGGDEFIVIYQNLDEDCVHRSATKLLTAFEKPIPFKGREHTIGACLGVASGHSDSDDFLDLVSNADAAMFSLKDQRKTKYAIYDPDRFTAKLDLHRRDELVQALEQGDIKPYFQPQVRLDDKSIAGFEALARWEHPTRGVIEAKDFLPDIDTFGLHFDFSYIILKSVCQHLDDWSRHKTSPFKISVNVSEITLATEDGFRDIEWLLSEYAHLRSRLTFEVTENVFLARYELPIRQSVNRLSEVGMRISMDDFGTGYGSFRHLKEFTFHELKIDEEFVAGIGSGDSSEVLIAGFIAIAEGLNADVVAEGVETIEQEKFLRSLGCEFGQGYLYGAAVPADNVLEMVARDEDRNTTARLG